MPLPPGDETVTPASIAMVWFGKLMDRSEQLTLTLALEAQVAANTSPRAISKQALKMDKTNSCRAGLRERSEQAGPRPTGCFMGKVLGVAEGVRPRRGREDAVQRVRELRP